MAQHQLGQRQVLPLVLIWIFNARKQDRRGLLATLTGAIIVSLGHERAGLFSNNTPLSNKLRDAGSQIGEKLGISQMHVSRLLAKTLAQLRDRLQ